VFLVDRERAIRAMHDEVVEILDGARDADDFHTSKEVDDELGFFNYFDLFETYKRITVNAPGLSAEELKQQRVKVGKLRDDYTDRGRKAVGQAKEELDHLWTGYQAPTSEDQLIACRLCGHTVSEGSVCIRCGREPPAPAERAWANWLSTTAAKRQRM